MSLPNRHNPYDSTAFLNWRNSVNYYEDDTFAQQVIRHYAGEDWPEVDREACDIAGKVSYRWRELTEIIATPPRTFWRPYEMRLNNRPSEESMAAATSPSLE